MSTLIWSCFARKPQGRNNKKASFYVLRGPSALAFASLLDKDHHLADITLESRLLTSPDLLMPYLLRQQADAAILPLSLAWKLWQKNSSYQCAAICGWGGLFLLSASDDEDIFSLLKKYPLYIPAKASTPDIVMRAWLSYQEKQNKLSTDKIQLKYSLSPPEIHAVLASGKIQLAILPQPFAALVQEQKNKPAILLDLDKAWQEISKTRGLPVSALIIHKQSKLKKAKVLKSFLTLAKQSLAETINNPAKAAKILKTKGFPLPISSIDQAVQNAGFKWTTALEAEKEIFSYLKIAQDYLGSTGIENEERADFQADRNFILKP